MASGRLGEIIPSMKEEVIRKACSEAMKPHKSSDKSYVVNDKSLSDAVVISFPPGYWSVNDWFIGEKPFGETKIDLKIFPSLRSIGNDEVAMVNEAFLKRFTEKIIGNNSEFSKKVQKAVEEKKQVVFTGHSTGGSIAVLATIWFLEKYRKPNTNTNTSVIAHCVTFGCPLTGNNIFSHALRRENWAQYFIHFVMKYDIVPRILLAPKSSIEKQFSSILQSYSRRSKDIPWEASDFYKNVMRNASCVASHSACTLMANTNLLLDTVTSFIQLSPYRPFGTYVFCTGNGKLSVMRNPNAVLQLLFYSSQLSSETSVDEIAQSIQDHLCYENELKDSFKMQNVVDLDKWEKLPLSADTADANVATINTALNDLGLGTKARLCLSAAIEYEKRKLGNQKTIEDKLKPKKDGMNEVLNELKKYKSISETRKVGYYDAFKLQETVEDFNANVNRLKLAGMWDEIIEMLKRHELPDEFEGKEEWITVGTTFRRLVEPLDIANYHRHLKNEDTGTYMEKGRPKRYKYTQRWLEHANRAETGSSGESCFWAQVEQLKILTSSGGPFESIKGRVDKLEKEVENWVDDKVRVLDNDVFLEKSTFVQWWNTLPDHHKSSSRISGLMKSQ